MAKKVKKKTSKAAPAKAKPSKPSPAARRSSGKSATTPTRKKPAAAQAAKKAPASKPKPKTKAATATKPAVATGGKKKAPSAKPKQPAKPAPANTASAKTAPKGKVSKPTAAKVTAAKTAPPQAVAATPSSKAGASAAAKARFNGSVKVPAANGSPRPVPPKINRPTPTDRTRPKPPRVPYASLASGPAPVVSTYDPLNHTPPTDAQLRKIKTGLTAKDLDHFRDLLLFRRAEIIGDVQGLNASRSGSAGEISHMPLHMADVGSDNYEQEFTLGLMEYERRNLLDIDDALRRIQNKTYGVCIETAVPIGRPRLEAKPWAKYSIEVARERERRGM